VKNLGPSLGLPLFSFEQVKSDEALTSLQAPQADLAVVMSFGQIIPQRILDLFPLGVINVHPSLLPKYRGATPINGAILNGDKETGVCIMKMDALMDHGPVYATERIAIEPTDTTGSLSERAAKIGADLLMRTLHQAFIEKNLLPVEQDHTQVTTVGLLKREHGLLDWTKSAEVIERTIRAYDPWPGTYTLFQGKRLKVLGSRIGPPTSLTPGQTFIEKGSPAITCGNQSSLLLTHLQLEGGKPTDGISFIRGHAEWNTAIVG
jgi:methionyl-tRNA formyltransferase